MHGDLKCIACGTSHIRCLSFRIEDTRPLLECGDCGLKFLLSDGMERLCDNAYWNEVNREIYNMPSVLKEFRKRHARYLQVIRRKGPPNDRLLDVGCGNGIFVDAARKGGYEATGIEPSPIAVELCRQQYSFAPILGYLRDDHALPDDYGVLTAWDVVEHLEDPKGFLRTCHRHMARGGVLLLETPDESSRLRRVANRVAKLGGRLDFRDNMYYLSHRWYFTCRAIVRILEDVGFGEIDIHRDHFVVAKSLAKLRLFGQRSRLQILKYRVGYSLLRSCGMLSNKQVVVCRKLNG